MFYAQKLNIGINFNRLLLFNLRPSVLDSAAPQCHPGSSFLIVTVTPLNGNKVQACNKRPQVLDHGIGSDGAHHSEHALTAPTVDSAAITLRKVVHFQPLVSAKCPAELWFLVAKKTKKKNISVSVACGRRVRMYIENIYSFRAVRCVGPIGPSTVQNASRPGSVMIIALCMVKTGIIPHGPLLTLCSPRVHCGRQGF